MQSNFSYYSKMVARVPLSYDCHKVYAVASEVATIEYMHSSGLPVRYTDTHPTRTTFDGVWSMFKTPNSVKSGAT